MFGLSFLAFCWVKGGRGRGVGSSCEILFMVLIDFVPMECLDRLDLVYAPVHSLISLT